MQRKGWIKRFFEGLFQLEAAVAAAWSSAAYRRLMLAQWRLKPAPDHIDHHIDLYYQWLKTRNSMWLERGIFSSLALKGNDVLELGCGDGFNARNFYSLTSRRVVACDVDSNALVTARAKNHAPNVQFVEADIKQALPAGAFDNVIWDFGFPLVQYFSAAEIDALLRRIKERLTPDGVLSGYTVAINNEGVRRGAPALFQLSHLRAFLTPHFPHVTVFETNRPGRQNLYFWASAGPLPFRDDWQPAPPTHRPVPHDHRPQ